MCRNTVASTDSWASVNRADARNPETGQRQAINNILDVVLSFYFVDDNGRGRIRSLHSMGETYINLRKAHACLLLLRYLNDLLC